MRAPPGLLKANQYIDKEQPMPVRKGSRPRSCELYLLVYCGERTGTQVKLTHWEDHGRRRHFDCIRLERSRIERLEVDRADILLTRHTWHQST